MKKHHILFSIGFIIFNVSAHGQINLKKKAEKKTNQTIDKLLFGKKKKNESNSGTQTSNPQSPVPENGNTENTNNTDNYTPEQVDWDALDTSNVIHFNTLINMLPEETQGFVRSEKPEGAKYTAQGVAYSTGSKTYTKEGRELVILLSDYLGSEYLIGAQTQQYEYESTDGFVKSTEGGGFNGWVSMDYSDNEGSMIMSKGNRFLISITTTGTSEEELKAIFADLKLSRLTTD